ncbi:MAG: glycosyltransferase [Methanobacterium sp.]
MKRTVEEEVEYYNYIKNDAIYAFNQGKIDKALDYIHTAASIAWHHHMGIWYDEDLENLLFDIGNNLRDNDYPSDENKNIRKNVYISTNITDTEGCPEVLRQWAKLLKPNFGEQTLYITHSYASYFPTSYSEKYLEDTKLDVKELSIRDSYINRIKYLIKAINNDSPDSIFLFIEPSDVVAIPTIHALNKKPKVIFFNHAEQSFWLGRNVVDYLVDQRDEATKYSRNCRHIENSYVIPLPTDIKPQKSPKKWSEDATISISVGNFHKVLGDHQINYFNVIRKLLERFQNHYHIFITNPPPPNILERYLADNSTFKERFIIDGPFPDLSAYYDMADLLIETFPISGGMVRLEAMACKLPIVAFHNKRFPLFTGQSKLPPDYPFVGSSEDEIINHSSKLIKNQNLRKKIGRDLNNYYKNELSLQKIEEALCSIIEDTQNPSTVINGKFSCDYDLEYARIYQSNVNFESYKKLLSQSIFKDSDYSLVERSNLYYNSLKNKEFKSINMAIIHAIFTLFGWDWISKLKVILD